MNNSIDFIIYFISLFGGFKPKNSSSSSSQILCAIQRTALCVGLHCTASISFSKQSTMNLSSQLFNLHTYRYRFFPSDTCSTDQLYMLFCRYVSRLVGVPYV